MFSLRHFGAPAAAAFSFRTLQNQPAVKYFGPLHCRPLHNQRQEIPAGNGLQGIGKSFDGSRRQFSSLQQRPGSGKGKSWVLAIGSAALGIGTATIAYLQSENGRISGDNAAIGQCAEQDCIEKKCGESSCLPKKDENEDLITKANQELEKALKEMKPKVVEFTEAALKTYCEATELIKVFMDKVYCAIEEENLESPRYEEVWCDVNEAAAKRCDKVKEAYQNGQCAWELLCSFREVIESGKACKFTAGNPFLISAEETLLCAERELLDARAKMDCILSESKLAEQYRNIIEDFRRDLKAEMDSILASNDCKETLTCNECNMVVFHAYKKILRIQLELAKIQGAGGSCPPGGPASDAGNCNKTC